MKCDICGCNETEKFQVFYVARILSVNYEKIWRGFRKITTYDRNAQRNTIYYCSSCEKKERKKNRKFVFPVIYLMLGSFLITTIIYVLRNTSLGIFLKERIDVDIFTNIGILMLILLFIISFMPKPLDGYGLCKKYLSMRLKKEKNNNYSKIHIFSEKGWSSICENPYSNVIE